MSGFIDPTASGRSRVDRLEVLVDEVLRTIGLDALSPEAQAIYLDLVCADPARASRARAKLAQRIREDPLDAAATDDTPGGDK